MRELLESNDVPAYLDDMAKKLLAEGRRNYATRELSKTFLVNQGAEVLLLTWLGDAANEALACLLKRRGFTAAAAGPGVEVMKGEHTVDDVVDALIDAGMDEPPPLDLLLADTLNLQREKWDWALPDSLLRKAYASLNLNVDEALAWVRSLPNLEQVAG